MRPLDVPPFIPIEEDYLPANTFVNFHFAPHGISEHLDGVKALFPDSDVFAVELVNWSERHVKSYKAITKGDEKILNRITGSIQSEVVGEYIEARLQMLFGSWKPIIFIDQPASEKQQRIPDFLHGALRDRGAGSNLDEALEICADIESEVAKKSTIRNRTMVRNLGEKATELVTGHPKLKDKPRVDVLVPLGFMHEPIYHYLREQPVVSDRVTASYWKDARHLPPEEEVRLAYIEGRSPTKDQLIAALGTHAFGSVASFVYPRESMHHPYRTPPGVQDTEFEVVQRSIRLMTGDDEGMQLIMDRLNGNRSDENTGQIINYVRIANQQILDETGQSIDTGTDLPQ